MPSLATGKSHPMLASPPLPFESPTVRSARIEAQDERHGDRCGACGYPLREDGPCPNCAERSEREARLADNRRVEALSAPVTPRAVMSAPPPTRRMTAPETNVETPTKTRPTATGNGHCPDCEKPYGKYRRCYACKPPNPTGLKVTPAPDRPKPPAPVPPIEGFKLKEPVREAMKNEPFERKPGGQLTAPAPPRAAVPAVVEVEATSPLLAEIAAMGKVAEALRGLSPGSVGRVMEFIRSGLS